MHRLFLYGYEQKQKFLQVFQEKTIKGVNNSQKLLVFQNFYLPLQYLSEERDFIES